MTDLTIRKADDLAHKVYKLTKQFPKEELFGITSQIRRAALSIVLNLIEGFARGRDKEYLHFLQISYGSLKETKYLIYFCYKEQYLPEEDYKEILEISEELGKMIWKRMKNLKINIVANEV